MFSVGASGFAPLLLDSRAGAQERRNGLTFLPAPYEWLPQRASTQCSLETLEDQIKVLFGACVLRNCFSEWSTTSQALRISWDQGVLFHVNDFSAEECFQCKAQASVILTRTRCLWSSVSAVCTLTQACLQSAVTKQFLLCMYMLRCTSENLDLQFFVIAQTLDIH